MEPIGAAFIDATITVFSFTSSRIKSLFRYEENIRELQEEIANLANKKRVIEEDVILAKLEGKAPTTRVNEWLMKASRAEDVVRSLLEMDDDYAHVRGSKMLQQYLHCWRIAKKVDLVKELNSIHFETVSH